MMFCSSTPLVLGLLMILKMFSGIVAASTQQDWFVVAARNSKRTEMPTNPVRVKRQSISNRNDVRQFEVESKIAVRFASTTITSRISNRASSYQPLNFILQLPLNAYIANFSLEANGVTYYGRVRDKCDGEDENTFDASGSLSTGRITALDPNRNTFMVSVSVAPGDTIGVMVNYQELLERIQGWYTQRISINPQQIVRDFRIKAYVTEPQGITKVESGILQTTGGGSGGSGGIFGSRSSYTSLDDYIRRIGRSRVTVEFFPTSQEQRAVGGDSGINGDFIIRYDIQHDYGVGQVQTSDGVFVHHFSPGGLGPIRKSVAFVIDVSASMFGRKLNQTKEALLTILDQMRANDRFNIITFSDEVYYWRDDQMVTASSWNINLAKDHVRSLTDLAGTNLNDAMIEGLNQLRLAGAMEPISAANPGVCILFVLTDGAPSKGVTDTRTIERNVQDSNQGRCSVVTLGFGAEDVDFNFLARLALGNNGVARKIFENSAVSQQLIGVYDEVATPLLVNVAIEYLGNIVDRESLTKTLFQNYFDGSEFAISGRLANLLAATLPIRVTAISATGEITIEEYVPITNRDHFSDSPYVPPEAAERTAAFITLVQLFNQYTVSDNPQEQRRIVDRTLQLSEQYNLLTPLMSMDFASTPATTGGGGSRGGTAAVPPSLQWGISGTAYGEPSQSRTYGIGGRICTYEPENVIDLERLRIHSVITDRYARTTVTGEVANRAANRQDVPFTLHIPPGAFISDFSVNVDGRTYTGRVGDIRSTEWQRLFPSNGQQLALVTRRDPTKDTFTVQVLGVAPQSTVTFDLTYDELLERRRGVFGHRIKLWPGQAVDDLQVDLYITEPQGISDISLKYDPRTSEGQEKTLQVRRSSDYRAHMRYAPSADEQLTYSPNGLNGDIVLEYDVVHTRDGSYTEVQDDYFVHFFSPISYQHAAKYVVFVLDISSSMVGTKLRQVKEALKIILEDLGAKDRFNILVFSDDVQYWRRNALVPATRRNIEAAKRFVDDLIVQGETNLGEAIIQADALLDLQSGIHADNENILSMMYVLSDGQPTIGITDPEELVRTVNAAINGEHALFCLGFGRNLSFDLLVQLALQNRGYARRIYETADASKQLQSFYFEVSRPVLFDVEMAYEPGVSNPEDLSVHSFPFYFEGSELSVAGQFLDNPSSYILESSVSGTTATRQQYRGDTRHDIRISAPELESENTVPDVVQRIWAIKTFQDLINQFAVTKDPATRQALADRIASLAIRYNFVTPLTPMSLSSGTQPTGNVPPPSIIHTGTTMDILRRLLEDLPVKPLVTGDPFTVATESSDGIDTESLTVNSQIALRFATTTIGSTMENTGSKAGWAVFRQKIPLQAFITDFTLVLDGKTYHGVANQKSRNVSLQSGNLELSNGGGFITELDPESKVFLVSVKLEPGDSAEFSLSYQMLLPRRRGMFKHVVGLYPGQVVNNLAVDVSIIEPQGVNIANAYLTDRSQGDSLARLPQLMSRLSKSKWRVRYQPTRQQQQQLSSEGIMGDFTVEYDVIHANDAGDIQVLNDYFVQFFSPSGLSVLRKHVVFVIDISSSMQGTKLSQVKAALKTILDEISPGDKFNILPFSNQVEFLDRYKMVDAVPANIQYAKSYVDKLQEVDATNINDAILEGVNMLRREGEKVRGEKVISMLVLLTDGEPTFGEVDKREIERNVLDAIKGDYSLFCLAFGEDADFGFLNRLALNNHGVARRIPERADASILLQGFYDEVATPLLYDLQFYFSEGVVPNTLSDRFFANYFNGSEIVIVGRLDENRLANHVLRSFMYGKTADREVSLAADSNTAVPARVLLDPSIPPDLIERIWAYVMIQTLERKRDSFENPNPVIQRDITDTSLRYAYLNPYTRMTVTESLSGAPSGSGAVGLSVWERQLPVDVRDGLSKALTVVPDVVIIPGPDGGETGSFRVYVSLCFDINGGAGDVISLVKDRVKGVYINGKIITNLVQEHGVQKQETYIGEIGAVFSGQRRDASPVKIRFTPSRIVVNANHTMLWEARSTLRLGEVSVKVDRRAASVTLRKGVEFTVTRYEANRDKPSFLGFYLNGGAELSTSARGLVGQFRRSDSQMSITDSLPGGASLQPCGRQQGEPAARGRPVFNEAGKKKVNCWVAAHVEAEEGFIEGQYGQYLMSDVFGGL
ncbi:uncharacterized protein LOC119737937 [Patiria miniata]|uniref:Inter-alpha-trypsin inhibitor heavy chain H3 n=1 Tax=Patiria miniata TaxID=46514 RepID=A0A914AXW6_PATMI|nr:uncharacterized protein LOC119737937 [Patiria miniata]